MNPQQYQAFTETLKSNLERDPRVLGLMAAGSMAAISHQPDEWSDHDFWLIVETDAEAWFFENHSWLPDHEQIVLFFREYDSGAKIMYRSGHLLEFAISDPEAFTNFSINDYRLLIDKADLEAKLAQLRETTTRKFEAAVQNDMTLLGQFMTNLLVGMGRYRRGEKLSARHMITVSPLYALLRLIAKHYPTNHPEALDNLDPLRRFELAYPEIGAEINRLLARDLPDAALGLLDFADNLLRDKVANHPVDAVVAVREKIRY